jgi:hypothetical protein
LLLVLASIFIISSESRGTNGHILVSQDFESLATNSLFARYLTATKLTFELFVRITRKCVILELSLDRYIILSVCVVLCRNVTINNYTSFFLQEFLFSFNFTHAIFITGARHHTLHSLQQNDVFLTHACNIIMS